MHLSIYEQGPSYALLKKQSKRVLNFQDANLCDKHIRHPYAHTEICSQGKVIYLDALTSCLEGSFFLYMVYAYMVAS